MSTANDAMWDDLIDLARLDAAVAADAAASADAAVAAAVAASAAAAASAPGHAATVQQFMALPVPAPHAMTCPYCAYSWPSPHM